MISTEEKYNFKPLAPNVAFLQHSGDVQEFLKEVGENNWRNNLPTPLPKKLKKIKPKSQQITLF